jgi:hypothetical protein
MAFTDGTSAPIAPELSATLTLPDYGRVARNPSRIDARYGDHFLQADFPVPNLVMAGPDCFRMADHPDPLACLRDHYDAGRVVVAHRFQNTCYAFQPTLAGVIEGHWN